MKIYVSNIIIINNIVTKNDNNKNKLLIAYLLLEPLINKALSIWYKL